MLRQKLSQKMLQKLSPQQIQLMKLLQIPTATLDQRIQEELESNPALDESEDTAEVFDVEGEESFRIDKTEEEGKEKEEAKEENFELDDYIQEYIDDDPSSYKLKSENYTLEDEKVIPIAVEGTFHDHLESQIGMVEFDSQEELLIAKHIVGSIDEDGYLRREPSAIIDDLMFSHSIEVEEDDVSRMLDRVQTFDPPGVGARDLKECLLLQLDAKNAKDGEPTRVRMLAKKILTNYFTEFSKKHFLKLKKNLNLSDSELKEAIDEILKLSPKPALSVSTSNSSTSQYVVPDFIIVNRDGELDLTLNSKNAPDLRINDSYMDMLKNYNDTTKGRRSTKKEKEAILFIKQKIDSAKWFIDAIKQRQETLYKTMYTIMQYQYDFFLTGDQRKLKPMILKDIAEITDLDISTISRVANSKFVQTEFGTKRLKDFFSESLMTQDGKEVSTFEVKNILTEIINQEDKRKPYSDEKLKDDLQKRGYNIARRTVAKYREQLNIPVARLRKEL